MQRDDLTRMTKIEVVIDGEHAPQVKEVFAAAGARGFTGVSGVSGLGHDGYHQGGLLFNERNALELLITVVDEEHADTVIAGLRPLLDAEEGVMFVSDTFVSRPEYFR